MKELGATASTTVTATPAECVALLAEVDRYPDWCPKLIPQAAALERAADGTPTRARATVHLAAGPFVKDFNMEVAVGIAPGREVTLRRIAHGPSDLERFDVTWRIAADGPTRLEVQLAARLNVPRLLPVAGIGESIAHELAEAARRELDGSRPKASASSS